jgi:hypothetical protein
MSKLWNTTDEQLKGTKTNGLKRMSIANFVMMQIFVEPNMTFNNMKETVETDEKNFQNI